MPEFFSFNFLCANIFFVLRPPPHKFSNGPSLIVHRSASDNLAVVHSSCLFGAESYSGQWPQEKLKTMLMQNFGVTTNSIMVCYGIFWSGQ